VQRPDNATFQVSQSAKGIDYRPEGVWSDARCHRVDREITPEQVLTQRRPLHRRQRARPRVVLGPRTRDVHMQRAIDDQDGSPEAAVHLHAPAEQLGDPLREGEPVALDHDIDIEIRPAEEHVSHESAHHVST